MGLKQPTLFVHFGSVNTRAYLFSTDGKNIHLTHFDQSFTLADPQLLLEHFKTKFKGCFTELKIISSEVLVSDSDSQDIEDEKEALLKAAKLLSKTGEVLLIDVGAKKTSLAAGFYGRVSWQKIDLGLGQSAGKILKQAAVEDLASLIIKDLDLVDIQNYLGKKTLYPGFIPFSEEELAIELAATALILSEVKKAQAFDARKVRFPKLCVLSGASLGQAPRVEQALFYFLQGWQPSGVVQVLVDTQGLLYPYALMEDLEGLTGQLKNLGTVISLSHQRSGEERLGEVSLDLGLSELLRIEIKAGELLRIPFRSGATGQLEIFLKKGVLLKGEMALTQQIDGGEVGIVIDARGRPLPRIPFNLEGRKRLKGWLDGL